MSRVLDPGEGVTPRATVEQDEKGTRYYVRGGVRSPIDRMFYSEHRNAVFIEFKVEKVVTDNYTRKKTKQTLTRRIPHPDPEVQAKHARGNKEVELKEVEING